MKPSLVIAPQLISASAGTGKTHQLSNRYLKILLGGEQPEKILATTYTRKAAAEIRQRIFTRLAQAVLDQKAAAELAQNTELAAISKQEAREALDRLIASQNRLNICTLDSFFYQIALVFSLELGLSLNWQIAEDIQNDEIVRRTLRLLCTKLKAARLIQHVAQMNRGNAKAGVERYLSEKVKQLYQIFLESEPDAWRTLPQLTPLAPMELKALQEKLRSIPLPLTKKGKVDVRWDNARNELLLAITEERVTAVATTGLLNAWLEGRDTYQSKTFPPEMGIVLAEIGKHVRAVELNKISDQTAAAYQLLTEYHALYLQNRADSATLSFDDIKYRVLEAQLLGNLDQVYYRLDSRIAHLLLDEFQDTANIEWQVIYPIVDEILSKSGGGDYSFFCVGDVKQAIYGWRGGNAHIFDRIADTWRQVEKRELVTNWRSAAPVITFVNQVFMHLGEVTALQSYEHVLQYWRGHFVEHQTHKKTLPGYVQLVRVTETETAEEGNLTCLETAVGDLVRELRQEKNGISIGILTRRNDTVSRLSKVLSSAPYNFVVSEEGKVRITDSEFVQLVLAALQIAEHPCDSTAGYTLAHSMLGRALGLTGSDISQQLGPLSTKLRTSVLTKGYGETVSELKDLVSEHLVGMERKRADQLLQLGFDYDRSPLARYAGFVEYVRAYRLEDKCAAAIRVMTVHQAKGLEFDAVILPELSSQKPNGPNKPVLTGQDRDDPLTRINEVIAFPPKDVRRLDDHLTQLYDQGSEEAVHEMLCVLYVALTRARYGLYLLVAETKQTELEPATVVLGSVLGLEDDKREGVLYETGAKNWQLDDVSCQPNDGRPRNAANAPLIVNVVDRKRKYLAHLAPSMLEGTNILEAGKLLRFAHCRERLQARKYGSMIHKLFEQVAWLDAGQPEEAELMTVCRQFRVPEEMIDQALKELRNMLKIPAINDLLRISRYGSDESETKLYREQSFAYRAEDKIISGFIDRLVLVKREGKACQAEIIDYKTDNVTELDIANKMEFYRPQLESYRQAASLLLNLAPGQINLTLAFVQKGIVVSYRD